MRLADGRRIAGLAGLAGLACAAAAGLAAMPAGATLVCPPGATNPSYCTNILPVASTVVPTQVRGTRATLHGVSGPGVAGGDITYYYFRYGRTESYGSRTSTGTIGHCPGGASRCPSVPAYRPVSAIIRHLTPCRTYHFRTVSFNPDGKTTGRDRKFKTHFAGPIRRVKAPRTVSSQSSFHVKITLAYGAHVTIELRRHRHAVTTIAFGFKRPGSFKVRINAPQATGKYVLRVIGNLSCGHQDVDSSLNVR